MASVMQVAKYILKKTGTITTMKLQKLVYYCQAWSLAWDDKPLFDEDFEAWANGPVCPELFERHRGLFSISEGTLHFVEDYCFNPDEIETIESVLNFYGEKDSHWLSELTHKELPWIEARAGLPAGAPCNNVIRKESMQLYYGGL